MKKYRRLTALGLAALVAGLWASGCRASRNEMADELVGAWRGHVQFTNGAFAAVKDLEFMYVFNAGGTMTESSNYDAMPPVPPAYGIWKNVGPRQFEVTYAYYWTKAPVALEEITKGGGWSPGGHGVLSQKITLSEDGNAFNSTISFEMFDQQGKSTEPASEASATGTRMHF